MPTPSKYRYSLSYYDGGDWQYYYQDQSTGVVDYDIAVRYLMYAPEGVAEYEISHEKGWTYHAMITSYTTPLKFYFDGAAILRHIYYTFGREGKCRISIDKLKDSDWTYEQELVADIKMAEILDEQDFVSAIVIEGGFKEKLAAKTDTPYTFVIDGNPSYDTYYCKHDGIYLQSRVTFIAADFGAQTGELTFFRPTLGYYHTEGTNVTQKPHNIDLGVSPQKIFCLENNEATSIDYDIHLRGGIILTAGIGYTSPVGFLKVYLMEQTVVGAGVSTQLVYTGSTPMPTSGIGVYSINITTTFTVGAGNVLSVLYKLEDGGVPFTIVSDWTTNDCNLRLKVGFKNRYATSYIPCLRLYDVALMLLREIGEDQTITLQSDLLQVTENNQDFITSGLAVQGLRDAKLKIAWGDVWKIIQVQTAAAFNYDPDTNEATIEYVGDTFVNTQNPDISTITDISNFKCYPLQEVQGTNLKIGQKTYSYDKRTNDDDEITNGRDEPNVEVNRLTPILNNSTLDFISPARADVYGIELLRAKGVDENITDTEEDSDIIILHLTAATDGTYTDPITLTTIDYRKVYRKAISASPGAGYFVIENVYSPETMYNLKYTPLKKLLNNGPLLRSAMKMNDSDDIKLQTTGKNNNTDTKMIVREGVLPVVYDEGADIEIQDLCTNDKVLFKPYVIEFNSQESININSIIKQYPSHYITIEQFGLLLDCYILKITSKPTDMEGIFIKALLHPSTDTTQLIR
jgi:hypothetical protein